MGTQPERVSVNLLYSRLQGKVMCVCKSEAHENTLFFCKYHYIYYMFMCALAKSNYSQPYVIMVRKWGDGTKEAHISHQQASSFCRTGIPFFFSFSFAWTYTYNISLFFPNHRFQKVTLLTLSQPAACAEHSDHTQYLLRAKRATEVGVSRISDGLAWISVQGLARAIF